MIRPALIASDVDGTLIDSDEVLSPRTRRAIAAAVGSGARFVLATGRPPRWITPIVDALGMAPLAVCANGSVLYDPDADRVISARTLGTADLATLADIAQAAIPGVGLAVERVGRSAHDAATPQFVSSPGYEHAWLNPDNTEVSMADLLAYPAVKLLVRKAGARSADMARVLLPLLAGTGATLTYSTDNGLVELMPEGISKASGMAEVAAAEGISPGETIAFGDMPNDIEMLRWAGHGVAMGNAHPDVRAAADEVTGTNDEHGVARVLEKWWSAD